MKLIGDGRYLRVPTLEQLIEDLPGFVWCPGEPQCPLHGTGAKERCHRCVRVLIHPDGSQTIFRMKPN